MKTNVTLRETNSQKSVDITDLNQPEVSEDIKRKWQSILNVIAEVLNVPAGLIMRITKDHLEVFARSQNKRNPYQENDQDTLGHGLYCETVIGRDAPLHIVDALSDEKWKDNPDVKLNMIAYYGVPIKWPNGQFFGTMCVLDDHANTFNQTYKNMILMLKDAIETDLYNLALIRELEVLSCTDALTSLSNRRCILQSLEQEMDAFQQSKSELSIAVIDLDDFKQINDCFGHDTGDQVLIAFSDYLKNHLEDTDAIGRIGGDEFLIVFQKKNESQAIDTLIQCQRNLTSIPLLKEMKVHFSFGVAPMQSKHQNYRSLLIEADHHMLDAKKGYHHQKK